MKRALELALRGAGSVAPNPMVGCVIVHNGEIIGEGFHQKYGGPHAEPIAVESVKDKSLLPESTLYVTLEPCSHHGKTPPCADLIIRCKIPKVIICNTDPFDQVNGSGIARLRDAGVDVKTGILEEEGLEINKRFFTYHLKKRPYVILKWAQSEDGFMDSDRDRDMAPLQISNPANRMLVHRWRSEEAAILVGANTVNRDNPALNLRDFEGNDPLRIVWDSRGNVWERDFKVFADGSPTLLFTAETNQNLSEAVEVIPGEFTVVELLNELNKRGIQSVLVEGGKHTLERFIQSEMWDEARITTGAIKVKKGLPSPTIHGELKHQFRTGNNCQVVILSPR